MRDSMTIESEGISPLLQRTRDKKMFNVFNIAFFILFAFICVYPFYYLIINSISDNTLSAAGKIAVLPKGINWSNYVEVFKQECLGTAAMVSLGRTVIGAALTVLASAFLGFLFTQASMWHRKFWYRFIIMTMYFNAGLIPLFIVMKNLGLTNNFWVYILPTIMHLSTPSW